MQPWRRPASLSLVLQTLLLSLPANLARASDVEEEGNDLGLFRFVTRPDLKPPKWNVTIYDEEALTPGLWFVGPYKNLNEPENAGEGWIGPHIYDGTGELVWSGVNLVGNGNIEIFRPNNVSGHKEEILTFMFQAAGVGIFLDKNYEEVERPYFGEPGAINTHELTFVDDGSRVLLANNEERLLATSEQLEALEEDIEYCDVFFEGFRELEVETWETKFEWDSFDHIGLDESTLTDIPPSMNCPRGWEYIHMNSADKTPEGDYYMSMRFADSIHKISGEDGHIMWRLGGVKNDFTFETGLQFSRQHDARYRGANDTHTFISFLDNANTYDEQNNATHDFSRGLLLALDEKAMTASLERHYDHPYGAGYYAPRRGNAQFLDNGNVFMGWSEQALHSEHAEDGRILMEANMLTEWLGTYRSYKYEWVGLPSAPPDVVSDAYLSPQNATVTLVHVSWNGATEVHSWQLFRTTRDGDVREPLTSTLRAGFETAIVYDGYAQYVQVEARDKSGNVLGGSDTLQTTSTAELTDDDLADEAAWQQRAAMLGAHEPASFKIARHPVAMFFGGFACSAVLFGALWFCRSRGWCGWCFVPFLSRRGGGDGKPSRSWYAPLSKREDSEDVRFGGVGRDEDDEEGEDLPMSSFQDVPEGRR